MNVKKYGWWTNDFSNELEERCTVCGGEAPVIRNDNTKYICERPNVYPHCGAEMWEDLNQVIDKDGYEYIALRRKYKEPI